ncbi:MAG: haloalkane dehalogenase [Ardenticatenaceae bacterium]
MNVLRTPEERFTSINLPDFPFEPRYVEVPDGEGGSLRVHYVDEGPSEGEVVLLLHGEPSWSFLYRKMIPVITAAGFRAIAPDLPGFGRSDKPADRSDYTYERLVGWMSSFVLALDLQSVTFVGQDWGGLIGLRVATENQERFARLVVSNTGMPTGDHNVPDAFLKWQEFSKNASKFPIARLINAACVTNLSKEVRAAYDAPFPDDSYKEGARILPSLVPTSPDDPASAANRQAWKVLMAWDKPLLTAFSDSDPVTRGGERPFQKLVPGAKGQAHTTITQAGHFLQEDKGEAFAEVVVEFMRKNA